MSRWKDDSPYKGKSSIENPNSDYNCRKRFKLLRMIDNTLDKIKEIKGDK